MDLFQNLEKLEHHAYCLVRVRGEELCKHIEEVFNIPVKANPDFFHEKYEVLGIDESRKIKENHSTRAFKKGNKRIFIIECSGITHEAQNSLLKIFEEPNEDTHFFLLIPNIGNMLPTLRSRLFVLEGGGGTYDDEGMKEVKEFIKLSIKEKIAFVDELAKEISDEKKNKSDAINFLSSLEIILQKEGIEKYRKSAKAVLKAREYMNDRSPSVKQLLEYVSLSFI